MSCTGLLVLSNVKQFPYTLKLIEKYAQTIYVHLDVPNNVLPVPSWSRLIDELYLQNAYFWKSNKHLNINILIGPLKPKFNLDILNLKPIDVILSDGKLSDICEKLRRKLHVLKPVICLNQETTNDIMKQQQCNQFDDIIKEYDNVVLGGTFDRLHLGHKIFLTHALLRAKKRLVIGVTTPQMIQSKTLSELILPVETRISELKMFLKEIDPTLLYEIVPIDDAYGPTSKDANMDMIVVSAETLKGGEKVNEIRIKNKLKPLDMYCVNLVKSLDATVGPKEDKISSSNTRINLLGTRLREPNAHIDATKEFYIIGLTGGIASGKSQMATYLKSWGAEIMDCDKIAHEIYEPNKVCYHNIVKHFGNTILSSDGRIDRSKLGSIVFKNSKELDQLNSMVWPELWLEVKTRIQALPKKHNKPNVVVIEAAVLLKAGWDKHVHEIWSMIVPPEEAIRRVMKRNNLTVDDATRRLDNQLANSEIVKRSHVVFSSQWTPEFTLKQAKKAWCNLIDDLSKRLSFHESNL